MEQCNFQMQMIIQQENFMAGLNKFYNSHQTFRLTTFPYNPEYELLEFKQFSWLFLNWEHYVSTVKMYRGEKRTVNTGLYMKNKSAENKIIRADVACKSFSMTILGCVVWAINIFVCALNHNTAIYVHFMYVIGPDASVIIQLSPYCAEQSRPHVISHFLRDVNEVCALLRCYAVFIGS
jgi:hypothetical protein